MVENVFVFTEIPFFADGLFLNCGHLKQPKSEFIFQNIPEINFLVSLS